MLKYVLSLIVATILVGCSDITNDADQQVMRDIPNIGHKVVCIDGVEFHVINSYRRLAMAPKYDTSGNISTCSTKGDL